MIDSFTTQETVIELTKPVSYPGVAEKWRHNRRDVKHYAAGQITCGFIAVICFALAIVAGLKGNIWLFIAAIGPLLSSCLALISLTAYRRGV
ncbi:MAG: hypothetical protein DRI26_04955 [Chloroflexi bacterium]|nr:MAG: hypothetical protein DRI26_04955 [Chloroflexota bacterium]